jgi:branched-chain amino acid transport system ATP-binding protein
MPDAPLLEAQGLSVRFGGLRALSGVSLRVGAGELVGVIGPNGAGKTTFLHALSGVVAPTAGRLRFAGEDLTGRPPHVFARRGVARTFQTPRLLDGFPAIDQVRFAIRFGAGRRLGGDDPEALARALLARVGLSGQAARPPAELPPARQRLLELAVALGTRPRLLLLDEVAAGLTEAEVAGVAALVAGVRAELGVAVIWIEHAVGAVLRTVDRVVVLHQGELIADAAPRQVAQDRAVQDAYLGQEAAP